MLSGRTGKQSRSRVPQNFQKRIHQLSVQDALSSLHSGPEGIGEAEAKRRLAEFGPNQVERVETTPLLTRFLRQFAHFFALILWFAAALALFAEIHQPGEGMGVLALAIVGVILINGLFSFWQEFSERTGARRAPRPAAADGRRGTRRRSDRAAGERPRARRRHPGPPGRQRSS